MPKLLVAILTCHRADYFIDALTTDWLSSKRCLDVDLRRRTQRQTWIPQLPKDIDYRFFFGTRLRPSLDTRRDTVQPTVDREPLSDEIYLTCGDNYTSNPDKMKAICCYALARGYDYLLRVDDDTCLFPQELLSTDFSEHDYSGAGGDFHPGGCVFLSRKAMSIVQQSRITHYADDLWMGGVLRERGILPHRLACVRNEFGDRYAVPIGFDFTGYASFHSCTPEVMEDLWTRYQSSKKLEVGP